MALLDQSNTVATDVVAALHRIKNRDDVQAIVVASDLAAAVY